MSTTNRTVTTIKEELVKGKVERERTKAKLKDMKSVNQSLEKRVEELERYSRKENVIIGCISQEKKESVRNLVLEMAGQLGGELHPPSHIGVVHRLAGSVLTKIANIIVRLNDFDPKKKKKKKKS